MSQRNSPTRIKFNYQTKIPQSPIYNPHLIHSGFVIGQPVAYTLQPQLPQNYDIFMPRQSRNRISSFPLNQSINASYEAPDPSNFAMPLRSNRKSKQNDMVSAAQYNSLLEDYTSLKEDYQKLKQKHERLQQQKQQSLQSIGGSDRNIMRLIEVARQNLQKEAGLLIQRLKLQSKDQMIEDSFRK